LKATVKCVDFSGFENTVVAVSGRDYWTESPNIGGQTTARQALVSGESYELLGQGGVTFPSGNIHYFSITVQTASFYPNYYVAQLVVTDLKWVVGETEYDLYSSTCQNITRLIVNGIHIRNTC
jgi:hypothetical protein